MLGLIFLLLMWLVALLAGSLTGLGFFRLFRQPAPSLFTTWLCGMALTSAFAAWLSLIPLPLKYAWGALIPLNLIILIFCRREAGAMWQHLLDVASGYKRAQWLALGLCAACLLVLGYSLPQLNDAGFYHVPTITYLRHHGLITGLGNIQTRFGFNSHWHVLQAALAPHTPGYTLYGWLNGFSWMVFCAYSIYCGGQVIAGSRQLYHLYHAFLILPGYILFKNFTAPSPDLPVVLLIWHLAGLLLQSQRQFLPMVVLVCFALTVKASALPAVFFLVPPLLVLMKEGQYKQLGFAVLAGLFIMAPWLVRNVVLSGYLVYPAANTAIESLDWLVPRHLAEEEASYVIGSSRMPGNYTLQAAHQPFRIWFPEWIKYLKATNALLVLAASLSILYWLGSSVLRRHWMRHYYPTLTVMAILAFGCLFWFFQMPNFRFGYGYLWPAVFVTLATLLQRSRLPEHWRWPQAVMLLGALLLCWQTFTIRNDWFRNPHKRELRTVSVGNGPVWQPIESNPFCWDSPTPCTDVVFPGLEYRGKSLEEGFRIKKGYEHAPTPSMAPQGMQ